MTSIEKMIAEHKCPVCLQKRVGENPKRALLEHVRRFQDEEHEMFRKEHFETYFKVKHGGKRNNKEITPERILSSIDSTFGPLWAARITIS